MKKGKKTVQVASKTATRSTLEAKVNDLDITPKFWLAATSAGLFTSTNDGKSWNGGAVMGKSDFVSVKADGNTIVAATRTNVMVSDNGGTTWKGNKSIASASSTFGNCLSGGGSPFMGDYIGAAWAGNTLHATWPDDRTGTCQDEWGGVSF